MISRSVLGLTIAATLAVAAGCAADATSGSASPTDIAPEATGSTHQKLAATPPAAAAAAAVTGVVDADGNIAFVLAARSKLPLVLRAASSAVTTIANGFSVAGTLQLDTPAGKIAIVNASVSLEWASDHADGIKSLRGEVDLPFPSLGAFSGFVEGSTPRALIAYDVGANLHDVEAPLQDDRAYLVFDLDTGFGASAGPVSVSAPGGQTARVVLDPADPSLYVTGSLLGLDSVGPLQDVGLGISARGLLPFTPVATWGIDGKVKPLNGHLYAKGTVTLKEIPISIDGELVVNVDPDGDGRTAFTGAPDGVAFGANGTVNLSADFVKFVSIKIPLGHATLGARITTQEKYAYVSGDVGVDAKWIPTTLPLTPTSSAKMAGLLHSDIAQSYLNAEGAYVLRATMMATLINSLTNAGIKDVPLAKATARLDKSGLRLTGTAKTPFASALASSGDLAIEAFFGEDPNAWYADARGQLSVLSFPLGGAHARIAKEGATVEGTFQTPLSAVSMRGAITSGGGDLQGDVRFHVKGAKGVLQTVTDGAVCGYETVKDGAICGYHTVTDGAVCGTHAVTDAAICGSHVVTDAAICGTHVITDGAVCGWDIIKSGLDCILHGHCKSPRSCSVASSCSIASTCNVANTCSVPSSCQRAKTCTTTVNVPDFDFGEFRGTLHVQATSGGASGSVAGQICSGTVCTNLPGGSVTLGANPKACLSGIPGASGQVCTPF